MPGEKIPQCINSPRWIRGLPYSFLRTFLWLSPRLWAFTLLPLVPSERFHVFCTKSLFPLSSTLICQGNSLRTLGTGVQVHSASPTPHGLWRKLRGHARRFTTAGSKARSTATCSPTSPTRTTSRSTWAAWVHGVRRSWTSWVFLRHPGTLLPRYSRCGSLVGRLCSYGLSLFSRWQWLQEDSLIEGLPTRKKTQKCCVTGRRTQRWSFSPRRGGTPGSEASHQRLSDGPSESYWTCGGIWWYGGDIEGHCDDYRYDDAKVFASAPGSFGAEGN